jgi:hypothetical protein
MEDQEIKEVEVVASEIVPQEVDRVKIEKASESVKILRIRKIPINLKAVERYPHSIFLKHSSIKSEC